MNCDRQDAGRSVISFSLRRVGILILVILQSACSLSETTQRINVDYNYTIEGITNELTLLNIARAREGMPLHYTSVQRLTGSVTLKSIAGFNAAVKAGAPTTTNSAQTAVAPTGTTLTDIVSRAVLSGGNVYTPSIGGEVDTGPSFDVNILDTQAFYQGILAGIPFETFSNFLLQGYDSKWLTSLLAEQFEFRLKQETSNVSEAKGDVIRVMRNTGGRDTDPDFAALLGCYELGAGKSKNKGTTIAPFSRVTSARIGRSLTLEDLALLDGTKLDISKAVSENPSNDNSVMILRPPSKSSAAQLSRTPACKDPLETVNGKQVTLPTTPPPEPPYVGSGQVMVLAKDRKSGVIVDSDITVTLRSPEGLIQFIGRCLEAGQVGPVMTCKVGDQVLFVLHKGSPANAIVSANLLGEHYFVADDEYRRSTMAVIALIERLVNLQKASTDRPITVPVQVVP